MNDVRRAIAAARRFLLINPPVDDFTAYSLWSVPLGLLRVAAGLRAAGRGVAWMAAHGQRFHIGLRSGTIVSYARYL